MQESRDLDAHVGAADDMKTISLLLEKEKEKGKKERERSHAELASDPFLPWMWIRGIRGVTGGGDS